MYWTFVFGSCYGAASCSSNCEWCPNIPGFLIPKPEKGFKVTPLSPKPYKIPRFLSVGFMVFAR